MNPPRYGGIAARAGRWSARHRKTAIFGWLLFVVLALGLGSQVQQRTPEAADSASGESRAALKIVDDAGFTSRAGEMVLVQSKELTAGDSAFRAAVGDVQRTLRGQSIVTAVKAPELSKDRHSALVQFEIKGDAEKAEDRIDPVVKSVDGAAERHPDLAVEQFGDASSQKQLKERTAEEGQQSQMLSLVVTLLILLVTFGALVAASVPVVLAMTAVGATAGLLGLASQIMPLDGTALEAIICIGLAVGVDYSLFYVRREREERAAGRDKIDAIELAAATSGRAVLVSGITVVIAMAGMLLTDQVTFMGMGLATMIVVAVAVLGSITVLPALLAAFGNKLDKGRLPYIGKRRSGAGDSRVWGWVVSRVMRRPVASLVVAGGLLIALAVPALQMQTKVASLDELMPNDLPAMKTYHKVQAAFPAQKSLASTVAVKAGDVDAPRVQAAIASLKARAAKDPQVEGPITSEVNRRHDVELLYVGLPKDHDASLRAVRHLREDLLPATLDRVPGVQAEVTGEAAAEADFHELMRTKTPLVFAFVLGLAFLLLMVSFRSIVIPVKAIVLNLISVGASYGLLTVVFQEGRFEKLLGYESNGGVASWLPLFLFVILFGLSMDYHVFVLSRVREAWQRGLSSDEAVSKGIRTTAGTITAAAVVMVAVFLTFALQSGVESKELGIGLAFAILIDATIIRGVLLPASMKLLGDWNWYLPRWLQWLPELSHEAPAPAPASSPRPPGGLGPHGSPEPAAA
jgi:uncharacterized membrane protein YdfJ with MMPL/SSD domain